jgi:hypothetical protein
MRNSPIVFLVGLLIVGCKNEGSSAPSLGSGGTSAPSAGGTSGSNGEPQAGGRGPDKGDPGTTPPATSETGVQLRPLAPFRGDGIRFARPANFKPKDAVAGTYRFEREVPIADGINGFQVRYIGRMRWSQIPVHLLAQELASRKLTVVGQIVRDIFFHKATADSGVPGPNRFSRVYEFERWDTSSLTQTLLELKVRGTVPPTGAVMLIEASAPTQQALESAVVDYQLESIGWSASVVTEELPSSALAGTWKGGTAGLSLFMVDDKGTPVGGYLDTGLITLKFVDDKQFELITDSKTGCWGTQTCSKGGGRTTSSGSYHFEGGVLTLDYGSCTSETYDAQLALLPLGPCGLLDVPAVLRLEPGAKGVVRANGMGQSPLHTDQQRSDLNHVDGAPGGWDVPKPPGNTVPGEPGGPINESFNACDVPAGDREVEPNDLAEQALATDVGRTVAGCLATSLDKDHYDLALPAGESGDGYFDVALTDVGAGMVQADVVRLAPDGKSEVLEQRGSSTSPVRKEGQPLYLVIAARPGYKYRLAVSVLDSPDYDGSPVRYTFNAAYHKAMADPLEPNDVETAATPVSLNVPVTGYLFSSLSIYDTEWFKVAEAPTITVRIEDGPETGGNFKEVGEISIDIQKYPFTAVLTHMSMFRIFGRDNTTVYRVGARNDAPWNKPFRLVVTKP